MLKNYSCPGGKFFNDTLSYIYFLKDSGTDLFKIQQNKFFN